MYNKQKNSLKTKGFASRDAEESFGKALGYLLVLSSHGLWALIFGAETPCGSDWREGMGKREWAERNLGPETGRAAGLGACEWAALRAAGSRSARLGAVQPCTTCILPHASLLCLCTSLTPSHGPILVVST